MTKIIFIIPKMLTREEFQNLAKELPSDFDERHEEFWSYIKERIAKLIGKIDKVYYDSLTEPGDEGFKKINEEDKEAADIIKNLIKSGSTLEATEDKILVKETESWVEMMEDSDDFTLSELLQENIQERNKFISERIDSTLKDGETALLFISPEKKIDLSKDMKIIRMCRFEPADYIKSHLVQMSLKEKGISKDS